MAAILKPGLGKTQIMQSSHSFLFWAESNGDNKQSDHENYVSYTIERHHHRLLDNCMGQNPLLPAWNLPFIITEQEIYFFLFEPIYLLGVFLQMLAYPNTNDMTKLILSQDGLK